MTVTFYRCSSKDVFWEKKKFYFIKNLYFQDSFLNELFIPTI